MKKVVIIVVTIVFIWFLVLGIIIFPKLVVFFDDLSSSDSSESNRTNTISANDFSVYDVYNNKVYLSDFTGKPTVVNFWATWCGYCVRELPYFENSYKKYGDKVNFLMVNMTDGDRETLSKATDFVKKYAYTFPAYYDRDRSAHNAYSVRSIPITLFLDKDGNLIKTQYGAMDSSELEFYIEDLIEKNENEV